MKDYVIRMAGRNLWLMLDASSQPFHWVATLQTATRFTGTDAKIWAEQVAGVPVHTSEYVAHPKGRIGRTAPYAY